MNATEFNLAGVTMLAKASGALWLPAAQILCISDLHLGKSDRIARRSGTLLPPYESLDTLARLEADINKTNPKTVICLGDSFDDLQSASDLDTGLVARLTQLQAGRRWIWIAGNHDPGPIDLGGQHLREYKHTALIFRHMAEPDQTGEISGHYHPKHRLKHSPARPAFLFDSRRVILPAYGTYTGGLYSHTKILRDLFQPRAFAILTGNQALVTPLP